MNSIVLFGASLLLTVLPMVIVLSSLANRRIDGDLSRHIGLNSHGAHIVSRLFRSTPAHSVAPIAIAVIIGLVGTMAVAGSLQLIYEGVFGKEHRGWRDAPRFVVWVVGLVAALAAEGALSKPVQTAAGSVVHGILSFFVVAAFVAWTIHLLMAGRTPWRLVIRPAVVTAAAWLGLTLFSAAYFSSTVISDSRLYGTIGVVFTLLTWFIAIGAVIVLGAAAGATWEERRGRRAATIQPPNSYTDQAKERRLPSP